MPRSSALVDFAIALPVALLVAYFIALGVNRVFGRRLSLSLSVMTMVSLLGLSTGILIAGLSFYGLRLWMPTTLLLAFGCSAGLSFLVASIVAASRNRSGGINLTNLLAAGESDRVEFKETARWNVRDGKKDARMEVAIVKTIAAFLNSNGGTLVIGANDRGEAVGLDRDLATLREPDVDRFELWLRDLLQSALGQNAAVLPQVHFGRIDGATVCGIQCPRASEPVFLRQGKGTARELWVRVGNSTRAFDVDEAVTYVARHFKPTLADLLLGRR